MEERNEGGQQQGKRRQQQLSSRNGVGGTAGFGGDSNREQLQRRLLELILAVVQPAPVSRREGEDFALVAETGNIPSRSGHPSLLGLAQANQSPQSIAASETPAVWSLIEQLPAVIQLRRNRQQSFLPGGQPLRFLPTATDPSWSQQVAWSLPATLSSSQLLPSQEQAPPLSLNSGTSVSIPFPQPHRPASYGTSDSTVRSLREQLSAFLRSLSTEQWRLLWGAVDCYFPSRQTHGNISSSKSPHGSSSSEEPGMISGYPFGEQLSLPVVERILEVLKSSPCLTEHEARTQPGPWLPPNASAHGSTDSCRGGEGQTSQRLSSARHPPVAGNKRCVSHEGRQRGPRSSPRGGGDVLSLLSDIQKRGTEPELLATVVNILITSLIATATGGSAGGASVSSGDVAAATEPKTGRKECRPQSAAAAGDKIPQCPRVRPRREYQHEGFPRKLHRLLIEAEEEGNDDIASFTPSGRAFLIHNIRRFTLEIIPHYFRHNKYGSFLKSLNLYGFKKLKSGQDGGAFGHECFRRDSPDLCDLIARRADQLPSEGRSTK